MFDMTMHLLLMMRQISCMDVHLVTIAALILREHQMFHDMMVEDRLVLEHRVALGANMLLH